MLGEHGFHGPRPARLRPRQSGPASPARPAGLPRPGGRCGAVAAAGSLLPPPGHCWPRPRPLAVTLTPYPAAAGPAVMHGHLSPTTLISLRVKSPTVSRAWERCILRGLGTSSCDGGILCSACPGAQGCMAPPDGVGAPEGAASSVAPRPLPPLPPSLSPASRSAGRAGTQPGKVTRCQHPGTPCHWGRALGRGSLPAPPCKRLPISRRH